ncbi:MAG: DNRLRE domain-containing protein [Candidatus Methanoperedens sp.]|nr:DNRLRE domain-containing protein [Candidatus Methanoperedens sp.]PKL54319.1 MAG: hypothetical protein CVV36_02775 [Candidatus Methanoperedenaceae archaeon HGW-Methanoperedenaceae-1]
MKKGSLIGYLILFLVALSTPVMGDNIDDETKSLSKNPEDLLLFSNGEGVDNKLLTFSNQPVLYELGPEWNDYINPDGSHTRKIFTGLKNYKNGNRYEPIDTTIIEDKGAFKVEKGAYKVHWSNSNNFKFKKDNYFFTYQGNKISQGKSKRDLGSFREVKGQKDKNKLTFKEVSPSIDLEYIYYPNLLKENIILKKAPDFPDDINDTLDFSGFVKYSDELDVWANGERQEDSFSTSGAIEFRVGGNIEYTIPAPIIEDSNNSMVTGEYELVQENGKTLLIVKVPYNWLINSSRVYPVIVDPSISIRNSADTFVNSLYYNTNYGRKDYLEIQSYFASNSRVLLRFPLTSSLPSGSTISSATLNMYSTQSDTGRTIDVWSVDDYWYEYTVTWNNQPVHKNKLSSGSSGIGLRSWSITSEVQRKWGNPLFLKLMDREEGNLGWYKYQWYRSWEYGSDDPYLAVTYIQNDCGTGSDASNTFSGANPISVPKSCSGYLDPSDTDDYYKLSVTPGSKIDVSMTPPSGVDFDLKLYDSNNNLKASSTLGTGSTDSVSFVADSSGDWRVRIYQYSGSGTYSLSVTVTQPSQNDCGTGGDASNTFSGANLIPLPKNCNGYLDSSDKDDYYKFPVIAGYTIDASMTPPSGVDFDLQLYDPGYNWKTDSTKGAGLTDSVSYVADSSGEWRIRIYQYSGSGTYSFSVSVADKTPPSVSISSPLSNSVIASSTVQAVWSGSDTGSGINRYEIQLDNGGWTNKGTATSHTFSGVGAGTHTIYVKAVDNVANSAATSVGFTVQQTLPDLSISSSDITFIKVGGN